MKKYLKISNQGSLDIRLVSLMGGTTKRNNAHKIGQFGTGLKYVLAYMVRNNLDFCISIDGEKVEISHKEENINNDVFKVVQINGSNTSITHKMGAEWRPWMIVREIYSNALDEGGAKYELTDEIHCEKNRTEFYIELTPEFLKVYNDWGKYFIVGQEPMFKGQSFAVHPSDGHLKIYKQGILIKEDKDKKSLFRYDIKNADINELREYKGYLPYDVFSCLASLDKRSIEYFLENCTDEHYEGSIDYDWGTELSESWGEAIGSAKIIHKEAVNNITSRGIDIDLGACLVVPKKVYTALTKKFEGVGALRTAQKAGDFFESPDIKLELRVQQALKTLEAAGYHISPELKFIIGVFGDQNILAKVNIDKKEVLISEKHVDKSLFEICTMLIEENEHFKTGFEDCSRSFQQHFINLYAKTLLNNSNVDI